MAQPGQPNLAIDAHLAPDLDDDDDRDDVTAASSLDADPRHHGITNAQGDDEDPDILRDLDHLRKPLDRFLDPIRAASRHLGLLLFFLGFHLFLLINLLQYLTTRSPLGYALGITSVDRSQDEGRANNNTFSRRRSRRSTTIGNIAAAQPAALRPREEHGAAPLITAQSGPPAVWDLVKSRVSYRGKVLAKAIRYEVRIAARKLERRGGTSAKFVQTLGLSQGSQRRPSAMLRAPSHTTGEPWRFDGLPVEIITHILLLAASPAHPDSIPCTVSLLSRYMHSLVNARLYRIVRLDTPRRFRLFRLTMALHRPDLGELVRKLQVGSSVFDEAGYLPEQVAEQISLAVGLEQILLSCIRLEDLSVDLFGLAALHGGTASLIETGAMPIRLCTELSIPDYLSLPLFYDLRHLDLIAFGLDIRSARQLREQLPLLQSLTLRYVTRGFNSLAAFGAGEEGYRNTSADASLPWHQDTELSALCSAEEARARRGDFEAFAQTVEYLRLWPEDERDGKQLKALTVLAWPTAVREISRRLEGRDVRRVDERRDRREEWDWSLEREGTAEAEVEEKEGKIRRGRGGTPEGASRVPPPQQLGGARGLGQRDDDRRRRFSPSPSSASASTRETLPLIMRTRLRRVIASGPSGSAVGAALASTTGGNGETTTLVTPTPLRLGLDPAYDRGPRRGATEVWWSERRAEMME